jgi:hypothetical protein
MSLEQEFGAGCAEGDVRIGWLWLRGTPKRLITSIVDFFQTTAWDEPVVTTVVCLLDCHRKDGRTEDRNNTFTLQYV